jgi:hypothetical protein
MTPTAAFVSKITRGAVLTRVEVHEGGQIGVRCVGPAFGYVGVHGGLPIEMRRRIHPNDLEVLDILGVCSDGERILEVRRVHHRQSEMTRGSRIAMEPGATRNQRSDPTTGARGDLMLGTDRLFMRKERSRLSLSWPSNVRPHPPALTVAHAPAGCRPLSGLPSRHRRFKFCLAGLEVTQAPLQGCRFLHDAA